MRVDVASLDIDELGHGKRGEPSATVRMRVERARDLQLKRQGIPNARLEGGEVEERARLDVKARSLLRDAAARIALSARGHQRVLRVARTIADLQGRERVASENVAEAIAYRP
jgi:magnesium chelatase family protein